MLDTIIGRNVQRHRHQEVIRVFNAVEAEVPVGKVVDATVDNYAPHKHPKGGPSGWPPSPFAFHFTPTSASWLNAVETFFSTLSRRGLKRGAFLL